MTWTLCSSNAAIHQAGAHANAVCIASASILSDYSDAAEGFVCMECHTDFVTNYSGLNTQIKNAITAAVSSIVAMDIVSYDPRGYLTREADMIMNKCYERYASAMKYLSIKQNQTLN